jgi:SAM-dependent methyltransferase
MTCPLCKSEREFVTRLSGVMRCDSCGLKYYNEMPSESELASFYSSYVYNHLNRTEAAVLNSIRSTLIRIRGLAGDGKNTFLDFGCGQGDVLVTAEQLGFQAYGFEYSDAAVRLCESRGLKMLTLDEVIKKNFDVVTAFEVVEHLPNPGIYFSMITSILKANGIFYFTTPNSRSFSERFLGRSSLAYPEHLLGFGRKTINTVASRFGFDVVTCEAEGVSSGLILRLRNYLFRVPVGDNSSTGSNCLSTDGFKVEGNESQRCFRENYRMILRGIWRRIFISLRASVNFVLNKLSLGETLKVTMRKRGGYQTK